MPCGKCCWKRTHFPPYWSINKGMQVPVSESNVLIWLVDMFKRRLLMCVFQDHKSVITIPVPLFHWPKWEGSEGVLYVHINDDGIQLNKAHECSESSQSSQWLSTCHLSAQGWRFLAQSYSRCKCVQLFNLILKHWIRLDDWEPSPVYQWWWLCWEI